MAAWIVLFLFLFVCEGDTGGFSSAVNSSPPYGDLQRLSNSLKFTVGGRKLRLEEDKSAVHLFVQRPDRKLNENSVKSELARQSDTFKETSETGKTANENSKANKSVDGSVDSLVQTSGGEYWESGVRFEPEKRLHSRRKRSWLWNQFFVIEEYRGPEPVLIGRFSHHARTFALSYFCMQKSLTHAADARQSLMWGE
uniref:Uncharacterized protein n=1 Tax=Knipowitschia caucasica TaxID=637954 RepID=A0AAV2KZ42_KNICA